MAVSKKRNGGFVGLDYVGVFLRGYFFAFYSGSNNGSREDNRKIEQCLLSGKA